MFEPILEEAKIVCDVCKTRDDQGRVSDLFRRGWLHIWIEYNPSHADCFIDVCANCLFVLLRNELNPTTYTNVYPIKQKFNELLWKLKRESK